MRVSAESMSDRAKCVRGILASAPRRMVALPGLTMVPLLLASQVMDRAMSETGGSNGFSATAGARRGE